MKGEGVGRTAIHGDTIDPHPALRAGLSLAGRGVFLLPRWEHVGAFCPLTPPTKPLPAGDVGATRWVARRGRRAHGGPVGSSRAGVHERTGARGRRAPYSDDAAVP